MSTSKLLGLNMKEAVWEFDEVPLPDDHGGIRSVCCSDESITLASNEGKVFSARIKDGEIQDWKRPPGLTEHDVCIVESGRSHHVVCTADNKLLTWGKNTQGQLGRQGTTKESKKKGAILNAGVIQNLQGMKIREISCGDAHTICLTEEGHVYTWGANDCGQLGRDEAEAVPHIVKHLENIYIDQVAAGGKHSFALSKFGFVYCWGSNRFGQLGLNPEQKTEPFPVKCPKICDSKKLQSICCGENHTAFLSQDGHVFTCGLQGQQDHAIPMEDFHEKKIEGFGAAVAQIACGRNYTLSYMSKDRLHFFGSGKSEIINLPNQQKNLTLLCGKNAIFVYQPYSDDTTDACSQHLTMDMLHTILHDEMNEREKNMLRKVLSNASCINGSFQNSDNGNHVCSENNHDVDLNKAEACFEELRQSQFCNIVEKALKNLLKKFSSNALFEIKSMRMFLIIPCCLYAGLDVYDTDIVTSVANILVNLDDRFKIILGKWLKSIHTKFFKRYVWFFKMTVIKVLNNVLNDINALRSMDPNDELSIKSCVEVLEFLNEINHLRSKPIPFEKFHICNLMKKINIQGDYQKAIQQNDKSFAFCKYPFLYDSASKFMLLQSQCEHIMEQHPAYVSNILKVRRNGLIEDAKILLSRDNTCFREKFHVVFEGEISYCGRGIRQEFFQVLFDELLNPKFGAFHYEEDSNAQWFNKNSNLEDLYFIGLMCGLALYNSVTLHLQFPSALFKKLLRKPVTFRDLLDLKPVVYRSMRNILEYDLDDFEEVFSLSFEIEDVELCRNGSDVPVTQTNKQEFINEVINYYFQTSIEEEFESFYRGFYTGFPRELLNGYNFQDLEAVLCGNERYDFEALERATEYGGEYSIKDNKTIRFFWEVFHEMELDDQKAFLRFLTGTDRIPAHGIDQLKLKIIPRDEPGYSPDESLPFALTCTNTLMLPRYTNKTDLKEKLLFAAKCFTGFVKITI